MGKPLKKLNFFGIELFIPQTSTNDASQGCITLTDCTTQKTYSIYIDNGKLTMAESANSAGSRDTITLIDRTTEKTYTLYVDDGKLSMDESEG